MLFYSVEVKFYTISDGKNTTPVNNETCSLTLLMTLRTKYANNLIILPLNTLPLNGCDRCYLRHLGICCLVPLFDNICIRWNRR